MSPSYQPNAVIRGPEWSNPDVTRTSLKVEALSPSQQREIMRGKRAEVLRGISKLVTSFPSHFLKGEEKQPADEEGLYSADDSEEFHQLQRHFQAAGIVTNNRIHYLSPKRTAA